MKPVRIFIAVPSYDGKVVASFCRSISALSRELERRQVEQAFFYVEGCSNIVAVRNLCAAAFFESEMTHLLFVDADQGFDPGVVFRLLAADKDLVGATVPAKQHDWLALATKARQGSSVGAAAAAVYGPMNRVGTQSGDVIGVQAVGTGMLLAKRAVVERLRRAHPELEFRDYRFPAPQFALFNPILRNGELFGEDVSFCVRWRDIGGKCWLHVTDKISHVGTCTYEGNLEAAWHAVGATRESASSPVAEPAA